MSDESVNKRREIAEFGEFGLIDHLTKKIKLKHNSSILGVGDDAAIIDHGSECTVVTTDLLIEGIHFDLMYSPLKHLGYKAVVVNLSDIYAMNAVPTQITVSIALSNRFSVEAVEEIYDGIHLACKLYEIDLVGGDTSSSKSGLLISVTAIGKVSKEKYVTRSGARKADIICVTGDLGAAYLGLQILEREKQLYESNPGIQPELEGQSYLLERQLKPEAQKEAIQYFLKYDFKPTSMIDISDGLSSDLIHICTRSAVGAYIEESKIPIHPDTEQQALKFNMDPITCALHGGEDYELLFTIDPDDLEKVKYMPGVFIIGEIVEENDGITLHSTGGNIHPLSAQGWKSF